MSGRSTASVLISAKASSAQSWVLSGSGKSTLLNMLAGLEKPTKGEIVIDGCHIEKLKEDELVRFRRENVGFVFQSFHLIGTMNAVENVGSAPDLSRRAQKTADEEGGKDTGTG